MRYAGSILLGFLLPGASAIKGAEIQVLASFSEHLVSKSLSLDHTAPQEEPASNSWWRYLRATNTECNWFMTGNLASYASDCQTLTEAMRTLVVEDQCKATYNFNQDFLSKKICANPCYMPMVDTLDKMAKSGCLVQGIMETMCTDCPEGSTCLSGQCLPSCKTEAQCSCNNTCSQNACMSKDQAGLSLTKLGVFGLKRALQELCYVPEPGKDICIAQLYGALGTGASLENICERLSATGCCAGTSINFGTKCALSNDTIVVEDMGTFTISDLENICPDQDFRTSCPTAPGIPENSCIDGYIDGPDGVELPMPGVNAQGLSAVKISKTTLYAIAGVVGGIVLVLTSLFTIKRMRRAKETEEADEADNDRVSQADSNATP